MGDPVPLRDREDELDYARMQWMMLRRDLVVTTGVQYSVHDFIKWMPAKIGIKLSFEGECIKTIGVVNSLEEHKRMHSHLVSRLFALIYASSGQLK